jgi:hypothetical protein
MLKLFLKILYKTSHILLLFCFALLKAFIIFRNISVDLFRISFFFDSFVIFNYFINVLLLLQEKFHVIIPKNICMRMLDCWFKVFRCHHIVNTYTFESESPCVQQKWLSINCFILYFLSFIHL